MADDGSPGTASSGTPTHSNRLAAEHSPYLLQHAHNPVDWYPWGEEAFSEARKRDVPIFLSIGYSTCHWCHVMEVESFEDEEVAKLLNDWFVSIKVDREERPDVDKVYMTYVQALYGGGGWPLSVFLSPDLKPLMGGTYFPPDDKFGRPGFKTVLRRVKEAWDTKKDALVQSGTFAIEQLSEALSATASSNKVPQGLPQKALQKCTEQLADSYDSKYGGFGSAPKFPRPVEIQLMLYHSKKLNENRMMSEAKEDLNMVILTLQSMARGGIHDHIGGGFHRYSVDECWHVPHFEKMLYDQGQLVNVYLDVFAITKDVLYSSMARGILDYLRREMIGPSGEIFSAEDADSAEFEGASRKKEGAFYIWTSKEVDDILGENAMLFKEHYYVKPSGNCDLSRMSDPHNEFKGKNVLIERISTSAMASKLGMSVVEYLKILGICKQKLFDVRSKRPRPHLDDKVIVSWNGLAISSFARASQILNGEPEGTQFYFPVVGTHPKEYMEVAEKAAGFIRKNLYDEQTQKLKHSFRNGPSKAPGFLDDYAFLISAVLDLYEFGSSISWLSWAIELQHIQDELFLDKEGGGYFNTPGEDPSVLLRVKEDHDGAEPSGNSVSLINLVRLASLVSTGSNHYRRNAELLLSVFEKRLNETAMAVPLMCCGADMLSIPSRKQVVLIGIKSCSLFESMLAAAHKSKKWTENRRRKATDLAKLGLKLIVDLIKGAAEGGELLASLVGDKKLRHSSARASFRFPTRSWRPLKSDVRARNRYPDGEI
ncbi:catalytics [Striga hermonthica]|uniref:Catalytics n=1 Tax=Striga hermonthica TaxID=68872 RepID=A0A9N7NG84_STRHE|nr:catalytics [Striga hermonthica]